MLLCRLLIFFQNQLFRKIILGIPSEDPDQAHHFVGPDLGPDCQSVLKRLCNEQTTLVGNEFTFKRH